MAELNPFIYDHPVPSGELIDREDETRKLLELAEGGHNTRLQGPRRYGKTSILKRLLEDADKVGCRTVYVDFLAVTTTAEVARRIHEAYEASLKGTLAQMYSRIRRGWRTRIKAAPGGVGLEAEQGAGIGAMQQLADLLDLPTKILADTGQRTIVVFDEFQDFLRTSGELDGLLRSKMQTHHDAASYIFCASESALLESHFADRQKPLFDQARPLYLSALSDLDLGDYIAEAFRKTGRDSGSALDLLLDLVRGHPQRAMLVAHHLWEQTPANRVADADTFDTALKAMDGELRERFEYTWNQLSRQPNSSRTLKAIAISPETLYNQRTLSRFELSKSQAASGAKTLERDGELWTVDGRPQIIDPLLERWVRMREG
ncbi:MAG TPA: ATP-binding protein [Solirubrobacterales bacterium]|jgi:hypothetical protein|nr:ATP-binding protein [Solirubrobacterales bacterium]